MIKTKYNGSFELFQICGINIKNNTYQDLVVIKFKDEKRKLYVSDLNCFLLGNGEKKCSNELCVGDEIWVDVYAFTADKSFIFYQK